jgi:outer membrane lipoprotein-sorting protein
MADDASCRPVFDAITRLVRTPNHQYLTQSSDAPGSTPQSGEMIFTGKATYILHDGRWQTSAVTPEETLKLDEENRKNSKTSCHAVRNESVEGVGAKVYTLHSESKFGQSEGQIWISKARALPLRQKIDLALEGAVGKSHVETRFVYSGIEAPAGMK